MRFGEKRAPVSAKREVHITNKLGLHARPAAEFVKRANSFRSEIWIVKDGKRYSATSLIDILRANLDWGATGTLEAHTSMPKRPLSDYRSCSRNCMSAKKPNAAGVRPGFRCPSDSDTDISKAVRPR